MSTVEKELQFVEYKLREIAIRIVDLSERSPDRFNLDESFALLHKAVEELKILQSIYVTSIKNSRKPNKQKK